LESLSPAVDHGPAVSYEMHYSHGEAWRTREQCGVRGILARVDHDIGRAHCCDRPVKLKLKLAIPVMTGTVPTRSLAAEQEWQISDSLERSLEREHFIGQRTTPTIERALPDGAPERTAEERCPASTREVRVDPP